MWYNNIRLKWKATDMKTTFSILCCAVATAVFALPPVRPVLPTVAHDDTETATNVSFAAWQDCAGKFNFSLTFVQEGFDGGRVESSAGLGDLRTLAFTVGLNARTSSPVSVMATVGGASAFTGLAPSMFYRRSWNMMRLTGRGLGGSSELLEVRVVPGSLSVFLR